MTRNERILALRGKMSFGLIAEALGLTRNVVAGVCFRADHPPASRVPSPNSFTGNKCGTGYRRGRPAPENLCGMRS